MITIISKRHLLKFYLSIIGGTIFFILLATELLFVYNKENEKGYLEPKEQLLPLFSIACYALAGYGLYRYIKNAPTISIDEDFICFNDESFSLTEIKYVVFTGKQPFKFVVNFPMEAATLIFNSGETKYIFDDMYSNAWEIKSFLKQIVIDKKAYKAISSNTSDSSTFDYDHYETFKGTVITSLRGMSLWGLIGFFVFMVLNHKPKTTEALIFSLLIPCVWFLMHGYLMNYFQVSDNFFVVRNHNFFWSKKVYKLSNINEVVFETQGKMPNCLRVITKDFRTKLYPAGTLRDKTWLTLKDKLETYNIMVRNECI